MAVSQLEFCQSRHIQLNMFLGAGITILIVLFSGIFYQSKGISTQLNTIDNRLTRIEERIHVSKEDKSDQKVVLRDPINNTICIGETLR